MKISRSHLYHPFQTLLFGVILGYWIQFLLPTITQPTFWLIHIMVLVIGWFLLVWNSLIYLTRVAHARYFWDYDAEYLLMHSLPWIGATLALCLYPTIRSALAPSLLQIGDGLYVGLALGLVHWIYQLKQGIDTLTISHRLQSIPSLKAIDQLWSRLHRSQLRLSEQTDLITVWEAGIKKALVQQNPRKVAWYYQTLIDWCSENTLSNQALLLLIPRLRIGYTYQYCPEQRHSLVRQARKASFQTFDTSEAWDLWSSWYPQLNAPERAQYLQDFWTDSDLKGFSFRGYPSQWKFDTLSYAEAKPLLSLLVVSVQEESDFSPHTADILPQVVGTISLQYVCETLDWIRSGTSFQDWFTRYLKQESFVIHAEALVYQATIKAQQSQQTLNFITQWIRDARPDTSLSPSQIELTLVWLNSLLPEYHKDTHQRQIIQRWIHIWQGIGERYRSGIKST